MSYENWNSASKVCVIGAGTMGSGIAAHLANIGFEVTLLDLTQESVNEAFDRAKAARPPHFFVPETASRIRLGSIEENLEWVSEADWVCEAVVEKMDVKRALFEQIEPLLRDDAMISTNTSGLQIGLLSEGRGESFRKRFLGTHFFNPPRYLKLLELIPTEETDQAAVERYVEFLENRCARRVVVAKDTPGFIANRFGMWSMFHAIHSAERLNLSVEQVDAICGPFLGRPKSGAFRLADIVGLDIMQDIANNLLARCPNDPYIDALNTPRSMATLAERGFIGGKAGAGYYKREGKELLALDLGTLVYRQPYEVNIPSLQEFRKLPLAERLVRALDARDEAGEYLRVHLLPVLSYADYLKEEISHSVRDFDDVMKWGFGWEMGPFEMIDSIGPKTLGLGSDPFYKDSSQRDFSGLYVTIPTKPEYATIRDFPILETMPCFNVRDLGDGVRAIGLTTKMGTINPTVVADLTQLLDGGALDRFVLTSEGPHFSAGFDLQFFQQAIADGDMDRIDQALIALQNLSVGLRKHRSVAAIFGYTLGAGAELALGCSRICAHAETSFGLPESKVGLLPGGGGTAMMAQRSQKGGAKSAVEACVAIATGFVSANADDARSAGLLGPEDVTVYHPDRLLFEAKSMAIQVEPQGEMDWAVPPGPIGGMVDRELEGLAAKGEFSAHDSLIAAQIKHVFTKPTSFQGALDEERIGFLTLCRTGLTLARIRHMLETGKPLRN